jgi:Protein of unknown function (DUF3320)
VRKLEAALQAARHTPQEPVSLRVNAIASQAARAPEPSLSWSATSLLPAASEPVTSEAVALPVYTPYPVHEGLGAREQFYQRTANASLRKLIAAIVQHEGPISLPLLTRRLAVAWGVGRVNERVLERVRSLLTRTLVTVQQSSAGVFLWPATMLPETYDGVRVPGVTPESLREAADLPIEEVANGVLCLLRQHISIPEATLRREVRRMFGFQRPGRVIDARIRAGIAHLAQRGVVRCEQNIVILRVH